MSDPCPAWRADNAHGQPIDPSIGKPPSKLPPRRRGPGLDLPPFSINNVGGVVKEYVYGETGQELTVVDGSQNLIQGETYFDGRLLSTQEASVTPSPFLVQS